MRSTPGRSRRRGQHVVRRVTPDASRTEGTPMNTPVTGLLILVAMFVGEAWLGFAGALGLAVSTLTAIWIGMDRGAIRAGLFGFNGVLVGAGLSLFLAPAW